MDKERIIQEFVPGKQVTLAHLIAHPGEELAKKIGVPDAGAIGIMTLTPGETAMIAGDLALKAADVHIGFLDRFSGAWLGGRSRRSVITNRQRFRSLIKLYAL
jgi:ethanolamine utilization protein EutS